MRISRRKRRRPNVRRHDVPLRSWSEIRPDVCFIGNKSGVHAEMSVPYFISNIDNLPLLDSALVNYASIRRDSRYDAMRYQVDQKCRQERGE